MLTCRNRMASLFLLLIVMTGAARAQTAENVAVIINTSSPASIRIGEHYLRTRNVPAANVIRIESPTEEEIPRATFIASIERPISLALAERGLQDRILYLVLTKGVPIRIAGPGGADGTVASVDSELTLLYRKMTGPGSPIRGPVPNPYFLGGRAVADAPRFSHREFDIFLVCRLDAFSVEEALALIDRAQTPAHEGRIVLDQSGTLTAPLGDLWLEQAATRLRALGLGDRVVLESSSKPARGVTSVIGYYSWGSNDPANRVRRFDMEFLRGAIAATYVSSDARTLQPPPERWVPSGDWNRPDVAFAGSPQSLAGDLIREGVTGVAGHVAEPFLQSTVRPEIVFPAYVSGFNLAEAFYLAIPNLSWQTLVIGDPLCAPFAREGTTVPSVEVALDSRTELPIFFSQRRLDYAQQSLKDASPAAVALVVLAETRLARRDRAGARQALEDATTAVPTLTGAHLELALLYEQAGEFARAAERYMQVIKGDPNNVVALNNLAYGLAVREGTPPAAKPYAQKAYALAPENPTTADTLGWVEYLLGNHAEAGKLIATAAKGAPANAEIRLHAAFIYAALNSWPAADTELSAALKLAPDLIKRADVRELQAKIGKAALRR